MQINSTQLITRFILLPASLLAVFLSVILISSCGNSADQLGHIMKNGKLVVLTINRATTYYYDREDKLAGPEYDMTQAFANNLDVEIEYVVYETIQGVINALRNGQGDIAAAGLTITQERLQEFEFGPVYQEVSEYLVCHREEKQVEEHEDMKDLNITVPDSTSYIDTLQEYPAASWEVDQDLKTRLLIEKVSKGEIDCTVSDSTIFDIERRYHPEIVSSYALKTGAKLAWMINKNNSDLNDAITDWFESYSDSGGLSEMLEKYYGYIDLFDYVDTHKLLKRIKQRLPKYKAMFIDAAKKYDLSPSLLAAQSYQESHWDPKAKSPTGVRGIMMLTQPVAKSLGVKSRLDAKENIYAGAKFMRRMRKIFDDVEEPDKTWLALAVYNVGRGHFRDAQSLATQLNKDPNKWVDMKEVLPLLSDKKYYNNLRYGYARGNEPVRYVSRIRDYDGILAKHFTNKPSLNR